MQIAVLQLPTEENLFLVVNKVKPRKQVNNTRKAYRLEQRPESFWDDTDTGLLEGP